MAKVYLSLGTNLGDRAANLRRALERLRGGPLRLVRTSNIYETSPIGVTGVSDFLNLAVEAETELPPLELLEYVKALERDLGRKENYRWGPRVIDMDILLYDSVTLESRDLTIPHPRMTERRFVLVPLLELAPDLKLGKPLREIADSEALRAQQIRLYQEADLQSDSPVWP